MVILGGCNGIPQDFYGSVEVKRTNGQISTIDVHLPAQYTQITNRDNADRLISQLESVLVDLKTARDQFPVKETIPAPQ